MRMSTAWGQSNRNTGETVGQEYRCRLQRWKRIDCGGLLTQLPQQKPHSYRVLFCPETQFPPLGLVHADQGVSITRVGRTVVGFFRPVDVHFQRGGEHLGAQGEARGRPSRLKTKWGERDLNNPLVHSHMVYII